MRIKFRVDSDNGIHRLTTVFIDGRNCGTLTTSPSEGRVLYSLLEVGCAHPLDYRDDEGAPIEPTITEDVCH